MLVVHLPPRGRAGRDNVDVAVRRGTSVVHASSAAGDFCGAPHVDCNQHVRQSRNIQDAGGVRTEFQRKALGCFAVSGHLRQTVRVGVKAQK